MSSLETISLLVGTGRCNANCAHCGGKVHREYAPKKDGVVNEELYYNTLNSSYLAGARALSISSSGEPTISPKSVTKTFEIVRKLEDEGKKFTKVNLYSNGIVIGKDKDFSKKYLSLWKELGLKTIYITVHNLDEKMNAEIYGIKSYPNLDLVLSKIHDVGLSARANVILSKNNICNAEKFSYLVKGLDKLGFDKISAWGIRNEKDELDLENAPTNDILDEMENSIKTDENLFRKISIHRESEKLKFNLNKKLLLMPDGKLSSNWCK